MKDYKDMADAVFRRRDEYVASVKRKQKIALNTCLSLCALCLATFGAFGIWKLGVVKPDPTIIGTTPPAYTEATEDTKVSIGNNATSEGDSTEQTQLISGNNTGTTAPGSKPQEASKPQSTNGTDPIEQATKPQVKPTTPAKPTLPVSPTLPVGPQKPSTLPGVTPPATSATVPTVTDPVEDTTDGRPMNPSDTEVPPTSGKPKPTSPTEPPLTWVPQEPTDATSAIDSWEPTYAPTVAATESPGYSNGTDSPEGDTPSSNYPPTEPVETAPCWTEPMEPTTAACCTEPDEPGYPEVPDQPATESPVARLSIYGKVIDENGNPVEGAKIGLYDQDGRYLMARVFTDENGNYSFENLTYVEDMYVYQISAPSGYEKDYRKAYVDTSDYYSSDYVFVNDKL